MSIPGVPEDRASYDVIYRAKWEGKDLAEGAAKARAELAALQKANSEYNRAAAQDSRDATQAAQARASAEQQLAKAFKDESNALQLFNKQKNNGFQDPSQYMNFLRQETEQQKLLNKQLNNGRDTFEQKLADIRNETSALDDRTKGISTLSTAVRDLSKAQQDAKSSDPFAGSTTHFDSYATDLSSAIKKVQSELRNLDQATAQSLSKKDASGSSVFDAVSKAAEKAARDQAAIAKRSSLEEIAQEKLRGAVLLDENRLTAAR